jgi:archaellum biogenesis protein FlaJ (TadC family)
MSVILTGLRYTTGTVVITCIISLITVVVLAIQGTTMPKQVSTNDKPAVDKMKAFENNQKIANWTFVSTAIGSVVLFVIIYFMSKSENKTS